MYLLVEAVLVQASGFQIPPLIPVLEALMVVPVEEGPYLQLLDVVVVENDCTFVAIFIFYSGLLC